MRVDYLKSEIEKLQLENVEIYYRNQDCNVFLRELDLASYENKYHTLLLYDPYNASIDWDAITPYLNRWGEVIINHMSSDILAIFDTMNKASHHTFQVLTKRAERVVALPPRITWTNNIWMGVSIENTASIYRCELLKRTDAKIKFISAEPLLESIADINLVGIDWLIVGGESGAKCRPMKEEWVVELRDLAQENNIPFFFKQWGGFHKKANGSELQGQHYKEYPV